MTPAEQAAHDKEVADKAAADKAAVAAKAASKPTPEQQKALDDAAVKAASIVLAGLSPGVFSIRGSGFGPSGSLTVGGHRITEITRWDDENVRGSLPANMKGEVVLTPSNGKPPRYGHYPALPPTAVTTTTTVVTK